MVECPGCECAYIPPSDLPRASIRARPITGPSPAPAQDITGARGRGGNTLSVTFSAVNKKYPTRRPRTGPQIGPSKGRSQMQGDQHRPFPGSRNAKSSRVTFFLGGRRGRRGAVRGSSTDGSEPERARARGEARGCGRSAAVEAQADHTRRPTGRVPTLVLVRPLLPHSFVH